MKLKKLSGSDKEAYLDRLISSVDRLDAGLREKNHAEFDWIADYFSKVTQLFSAMRLSDRSGYLNTIEINEDNCGLPSFGCLSQRIAETKSSAGDLALLRTTVEREIADLYDVPAEVVSGSLDLKINYLEARDVFKGNSDGKWRQVERKKLYLEDLQNISYDGQTRIKAGREEIFASGYSLVSGLFYCFRIQYPGVNDKKAEDQRFINLIEEGFSVETKDFAAILKKYFSVGNVTRYTLGPYYDGHMDLGQNPKVEETFSKVEHPSWLFFGKEIADKDASKSSFHFVVPEEIRPYVSTKIEGSENTEVLALR